MSSPTHFKQQDTAALIALIREFPLATLIMPTPQGIVVNHIPMHLSAESKSVFLLTGHVPRSNPVWREYVAESMAIAVFHGPQAYISPTWYASKKQHGRAVPTWNYTTVHAHGPVDFIHDHRWLMCHVEALTDHLESASEHPWAVSDTPGDFTERLVDHLVGVQIRVQTLEGKWPVSQNRPTEDRAGIVEGLKGEGDAGSVLMSELVARGDD